MYDESGEDVSIEQSGDYTLFEYDLLNRLVSVSKIDEDTGALRQVVSYRYNHKNLRIERTDDEGTTRYVFDLAGNIIEEHDAEALTRYVFRNNKHLAKITPDGKTYYYGTDMLGSTTVLFDDAGNAVWKGEISAFGDVVLGEWIGEELFDERVRFTGKDYDEVTGLYYFNARWYDPQLGRFTSEDPVRDGMNWHVYTYNNPLKYTDPTGLDPNYAGMDVNYYYSGPSGSGSGNDPGSGKRNNKQNSSTVWKERTPDGAIDGEESEDEERVRKWWNGGWKQRRMERGGFIPEGTYSSDEIDSLYSIYKLDRAIATAELEGLIDQPLAEDLRNAIGDATMLLLSSRGASVAGEPVTGGVHDLMSIIVTSRHNTDRMNHYSRNAENDAFLMNIGLYKNSNISTDQMAKNGWRMIPQKYKKFHNWGLGNELNQKWVYGDGSYGKYEIILGPNAGSTTFSHVTEPKMMGSLNRGKNFVTHYLLDIDPYFRHGNSPNDPTTEQQRRDRFWE